MTSLLDLPESSNDAPRRCAQRTMPLHHRLANKILRAACGALLGLLAYGLSPSPAQAVGSCSAEGDVLDLVIGGFGQIVPVGCSPECVGMVTFTSQDPDIARPANESAAAALSIFNPILPGNRSGTTTISIAWACGGDPPTSGDLPVIAVNVRLPDPTATATATYTPETVQTPTPTETPPDALDFGDAPDFTASANVPDFPPPRYATVLAALGASHIAVGGFSLGEQVEDYRVDLVRPCAGDCDGDGAVRVDDIVRAIGNALQGCTPS